MMRHAHLLSLSLLLSLWCFSAIASSSKFEITAFSPADEQFLDQQRSAINELARQKLGRRIGGDARESIQVLQILLDRNIVTKDHIPMLQAMGVVLGDLYVKELGVRWVIYSDEKGRSRALQWVSSKHVLFPVTMVSRRISADLTVNVAELYKKGLDVLHRVIKDESRRQTLNIH